MQGIEIIPSLLSADFRDLRREISSVESGGCRRLHLDVMDGHFVPNLSLGAELVGSIRKRTRLYFQTHLMVAHPERFVEAFKRAGSDCLIIHREACRDFRRTLRMIKGAGLDAGIALRPSTAAETIADIAGLMNMVLVMTVEPGFGGQDFISGSEKKVARVKALLEREGCPDIPIGVDGGINLKTIPRVVKAGASFLVAGNAVFQGNIQKNLRALYKKAKGAE